MHRVSMSNMNSASASGHRPSSGIKNSHSSHHLHRKASTLSASNQHPDSRKGRKKDAIEKFLESSQPVIISSLNQLRHSILCEGLPKPEDGDGDDLLCPYRVYVWSILLRAPTISTEEYIDLVQRGESTTYGKILNDSFRTFKKDEVFTSKVNEGTIVRLLNCYALEIENNNGNNITDLKLSSYVQGMNILLAPIAYIAKSEPEAYSIYWRLLTTYIPRYVVPNLEGVADGVKLVDLVLEIVDNKLYTYLKSKMMLANIYALPSVLTLCACTPSLNEVLELWDFLFAYGCHVNIFFIVAQVVLMRDKLLVNSNPMSLLREFPPIDSKKIIRLSLSFVKVVPDELHDLIVRHLWDPSVSNLVSNYNITK